MKVYHIAAECASLIKVGGLADVLFGLTRHLSLLGHDVEIILPYYQTLDKKKLTSLSILTDNFHQQRIWQGKLGRVTITLLEPLEKDYFRRQNVYGEADDAERFTFFSYYAHLYLLSQKAPFLVHLHDWHTAFLALLNQQRHYHTLYTIHNLAYLGECDYTPFLKLNIPESFLTSIKENNCYNLTKGALLYSDKITTVSKTYGEEIIYTPLGGPLQKELYQLKEKVSGIINGIDYDAWNPEKDPYLPYHYSMHNRDNKQLLKKEIRTRFQLYGANDFLACSITRLVPQKGPELILEAIEEVIQLGGSYLLLGSAFDPSIEEQFFTLKSRLRAGNALHLELVYNEELSHLVYAASDLFIMPSLFEPCGLTQLIALRYGTIPLVRETGGLKDTIFENKNGFTFQNPEGKEIRHAIGRAFSLWNSDQPSWQRLQYEGMQEIHDWNQSAKEYVAQYESIASLSLKDASHTLC